MYLSVFLFGLDGNLVSPGRYSANCQGRIWLASLGFTTAFGAMFAKIWRVYVIFTNRKLRKKVRVLSPSQRPLSCCFGRKGFLGVDLGRGKKRQRAGNAGKRKERREVPTLLLLSSFPAPVMQHGCRAKPLYYSKISHKEPLLRREVRVWIVCPYREEVSAKRHPSPWAPTELYECFLFFIFNCCRLLKMAAFFSLLVRFCWLISWLSVYGRELTRLHESFKTAPLR